MGIEGKSYSSIVSSIDWLGYVMIFVSLPLSFVFSQLTILLSCTPCIRSDTLGLLEYLYIFLLPTE